MPIEGIGTGCINRFYDKNVELTNMMCMIALFYGTITLILGHWR